MQQKPQLTFWQIWNMCFGFLGIQMGFALQNANVSRIFQSLGAEIDDIAILWIAAPVTGLIVQPIIGYMSDRTWNRLGRRRPFFLAGAILASLSLFVMPNSPVLWMAAGMLWIMDASLNICMEPFRALVGDMLPDRQRAVGFTTQSFFIGVGAVVASALPWMMSNWLDISNTAEAGAIPMSVQLSFYIGGAALFLAVGWTILRTREYPPEQLAAWEANEKATASASQTTDTQVTGTQAGTDNSLDAISQPAQSSDNPPVTTSQASALAISTPNTDNQDTDSSSSSPGIAPSASAQANSQDVFSQSSIAAIPAREFLRSALIWGGLGALLLVLLLALQLDRQLYILGAGLLLFAGIQLLCARLSAQRSTDNGFYQVIALIKLMPSTMKQLAVVQFLSWFALFAMWIYTTPAVTAHHFGSTDTASAAYNNGADWVGVLFASYNLYAALAAFGIAWLANRLGSRKTHLINMLLGGAGLASIAIFNDPNLLLISMAGVGIAWASILSLPYALLSTALPAAYMGVYMGIFNFFIVIPQILAATVLGVLMRTWFDGNALWVLVLGGLLMALSGLATLFVKEQ